MQKNRFKCGSNPSILSCSFQNLESGKYFQFVFYFCLCIANLMVLNYAYQSLGALGELVGDCACDSFGLKTSMVAAVSAAYFPAFLMASFLLILFFGEFVFLLSIFFIFFLFSLLIIATKNCLLPTKNQNF